MQASAILHELLSSSIHKTRLKSLISIVNAVIMSKTLQLSKLGRSLNGKAKERSGIRLIDRFLSNKFYQSKSILIYQHISSRVLKNNKSPDMVVDWSSIPNSQYHCKGKEHCILRAVLPTTGRGITLYEEVHPKAKENNPKIHRDFLKNLKSVLPSGTQPCLITDAGFKNPWFKAVLDMGWDYVGRVRGSTQYDQGNGFHPIKTLFQKATNKARYLGFWAIAKTNALFHHVVLYKGISKGRHKTTKTKKRDQSKDSKKHRAGWKEPWLLVTSLAEARENPDIVRIKYKRRMTIEENFRDTKSTKFGLSFDKNITIKPERYVVWFMLGALASLVAWLTGSTAERLNLHYDFQANSYKHRRVLSFFYLGCQIIRKKINFDIDWALILKEQ
ncbi:IS4 family transposase [Legionella genomosp. 1]|uniref:IS4 family transposase n=1 Tax=Legionella genomosp. 1 TaxID=1093625 RepID=UPI001054EF2B|nr:IS4 family transposase [Legionella genomosp. 1]